jgi:uracil DNA glycosylase
LTIGTNKESHAEYWLPFMNDLFAYLAKYKDDMVIVRMGKVAQNILIDKDRFTVLDTTYPMVDTYGNNNLFQNKDVFNHINKINFVISKNTITWTHIK